MAAGVAELSARWHDDLAVIIGRFVKIGLPFGRKPMSHRACCRSEYFGIATFS